MEDSAAREETEAVVRAQARDQEAFRWLVERHRHTAYGVALRILRSSEDAEDVAQEAFVRAWRALPGFRRDAKFSTWLHRIVARRALDRLAVVKRRRAHETAVELPPEVPVEDAGTAAGAIERSRRLDALIGELPAMQRAVLALFYYEDRSVSEVAETLGIPEGTVKTHLSRGRAALRRAWARAEAGS